MPNQKVLANTDAEQSVLGSVFFDESTIKGLVDKLKTSDFYYLRHQYIFDAMCDLFKMKTPIDTTTVISYLDNRGRLNDCGGAEYILSLMDAVPSTSNVDAYVESVRDKATQRAIVKLCNDIVTETNTDIKDNKSFIDSVEKRMFEVTKDRGAQDLVGISSVLDEVIVKIQKNAQITSRIIGYDTGYHKLNEKTLGFQDTQLIILAARPAMGKTALALNIACNIASLKSRPYVAFFSLEMGLSDLVIRLLSQISNIPQGELKTGQFTDSNAWNRINYAVDTLRGYNIMFDDSGASTVQDLRSICRKKKNEGKLDFVVIDYLQLLSSSNKNDSRTQEVSEISRILKAMAKELNIPVLALAQLSRSVESRKPPVPVMSDLRESGSIEQDADLILSIYRDEYYNKENSEKPGTAQIDILKNRSGMTGTFDLIFKGACTNFIDMDESREE